MSEERAKRLVDNWKHGFKTRIREAVLAEREACARLVDGIVLASLRADVQRKIAAAIRGRE